MVWPISFGGIGDAGEPQPVSFPAGRSPRIDEEIPPSGPLMASNKATTPQFLMPRSTMSSQVGITAAVVRATSISAERQLME
jgi:hypothetical protein